MTYKTHAVGFITSANHSIFLTAGPNHSAPKHLDGSIFWARVDEASLVGPVAVETLQIRSYTPPPVPSLRYRVSGGLPALELSHQLEEQDSQYSRIELYRDPTDTRPAYTLEIQKQVGWTVAYGDFRTDDPLEGRFTVSLGMRKIMDVYVIRDGPNSVPRALRITAVADGTLDVLFKELLGGPVFLRRD